VHHPVTFTRLGDFTVTRRLLILSAIAVGLGLAGAVVALMLLDLIALSANLFFPHRLSIEAASPVTAFPKPSRQSSLGDLLQGRMQVLDAEQRRERVLTFRMPLPAWGWDRGGEF
jgi:hypothetical protein